MEFEFEFEFEFELEFGVRVRVGRSWCARMEEAERPWRRGMPAVWRRERKRATRRPVSRWPSRGLKTAPWARWGAMPGGEGAGGVGRKVSGRPVTGASQALRSVRSGGGVPGRRRE
jgi:hypothetical protein